MSTTDSTEPAGLFANQSIRSLTRPSQCPYGKPGPQILELFSASRCDPRDYEQALETGWRRSSIVFYRNRCPGCRACIPLRIDAETLVPTKSQRRSIKKNEDITLTFAPASFEREDYELFTAYQASRHPDESNQLTETDYFSAYIHSPVPNALIRYRTPGGALAAVSYLDILPNGLSSVYFAFHPDFSSRSLGTWSVFAESNFLRSLGKRWYYLGFWVPGSPTMDYKDRFRPHETAENGIWQAATL
ncbi:MAG TPA: arginyltransferase [Treponemataceae bacterium]|nr:arginyltransferase [Treponemataceae bacterium]HQL31659.1 arginyltransferase [Treponemataceae bacterium]